MRALHALIPFTAARRSRLDVRSDRVRFSAVLASAVRLLPRSQSRAEGHAGRMAARRARSGATRCATRGSIPGALRFIIASFVYQDAIGTIVGFMALYAVKAVGFDKGSEITLFLVLTIPSIFGSYIYGHLVDRLGAKRSLMMTILLWIALLAVMIAVPGKNAFWLVGLAIGLNFGGVPTAERPVLLSLVPDVEAGRYFSLMLLSSRAAAIVGPLIWGSPSTDWSRDSAPPIAYRAAVMTVAAMFVIAALILRGVPDRSRRSRHDACTRCCAPIAGVALRWYYRDIQVDGLERIPRQRPLLLVVNHPNALVDALLVGWIVPRRVFVTAKSTLFTNPLADVLLRALGVVPLYRASDAVHDGERLDPARNRDTLSRGARRAAARWHGADLSRGKTHDEPSLAPLKTGAARMALEARDAGDVTDLAIVPIGLTFERKDVPRIARARPDRRADRHATLDGDAERGRRPRL